MIERYAKWLVAHPWLVLFGGLIIAVVCASGMPRLAMDQDYRVFFSKEFPPLEALDDLHDTYNKNDNLLMALSWSDGGAFTREHLRQVKEVTEKAWKIPYSVRVESLTNYQYTAANGDDLVVEDFIRSPEELSDADLTDLKRTALADPMLVDRLVGTDGEVVGVDVIIELPGESNNEAGEVMQYARQLRDRVAGNYPGLKIHFTGIIPMNSAFPEASMADMSLLVPLMYLVILVLVGVFLRSVWGTFGTLLIIMLAVTSALGVSAYLGISITPPSASTPTMIMTLALADCIHFLTYMIRLMRDGIGRKEAIIESMKANFHPMFLTTAAAVAGFLSMNFSESPPFRDLGNITAFGVIAAFVFSVSVLPALIAIVPLKGDVAHQVTDRFVNQMADAVIRYRKVLFFGGLAFVVLTGSFVPRIVLNDEWIKYFDESFEFRSDTEFASKNLTGIYTIEYSIPANGKDGIKDPEYLKSLSAFVDWWRSRPDVRHVSAITDMLKRINMNLNGDDISAYRIPDTRSLVSQYLMVYEMSLPFGHDLGTLINIDKSASRLLVSLDTVSTVELKKIEREAAEWLSRNAPEYMFAQGSSATVMFAHISQRNIRQMLSATTMALLVVSLILVYALRSFKLGVLSLVPNLAPAITGFGIWGLLVGEVGLATSIVAAVTIGIVIDDTIHFLSKYRRGRQVHGYSPEDAVRYAFSTVGVAMTVTTVALVAGFLVLSQSTFEMNAGMGMLTALVLMLALVADFTLLPAMLIWLETRKEATQDTEISSTELRSVELEERA